MIDWQGIQRLRVVWTRCGGIKDRGSRMAVADDIDGSWPSSGIFGRANDGRSRGADCVIGRTLDIHEGEHPSHGDSCEQSKREQTCDTCNDASSRHSHAEQYLETVTGLLVRVRLSVRGRTWGRLSRVRLRAQSYQLEWIFTFWRSRTMPPCVYMTVTKRAGTWRRWARRVGAGVALLVVGASAVAALSLASGSDRLENLRRGVLRDHIPTVSRFLARGGHVDTRLSGVRGDWRTRQSTPLMWASFGNAEGTIRLLLESGANIAITDEGGRTALHYAAETGAVRAIALLLDAGSNAATEDNWGLSALTYAIQHRQLGVIEYLTHPGMDSRLLQGAECAPLHMAAATGQVWVLERLLDRGADVNAVQKSDGRTALMLAAGANDEATVAVLLRHGARVDDHDRNGRTALSYAAQSGSAVLASQLRAAGASVSVRCARGLTPLDYIKERRLSNEDRDALETALGP